MTVKESFEVTTEKLPLQQTVAVRMKVTPEALPTVMGAAYQKIMAYLNQVGAQPTGPAYCMYINWRTEKWRIELGIPVARPLPGAGEVAPSTLPSGEALTAVHIGPYDKLGDAWGALDAWANEHHIERGNHMWEVYLTDPEQVPDPAHWQTKLVVMIKA